MYLYLPGSAWPAASGDLPAGAAEVVSWSIDRDLTSPLLPGQVRGASGFSVATGQCTIAQPDGVVWAPWATGGNRIPASGACKLIASYDGPLGATAFTLGNFLLDPMSGKASEKFLTVDLIENLVALGTPHRLPAGVPYAVGGTPPSFSPSVLIDAGMPTGVTASYSSAFTSQIQSSYFPGTTTTLAALQEIVAANLGAMFMATDGVTLKIKDAGYMAGGGTITETLVTLDDLADLQWSQDPAEVVDRIELTYQPAVIDSDTPVVWVAPPGMILAAGATVTLDFDPGRPVLQGLSASSTIASNSLRTGLGTVSNLPVVMSTPSSGRVVITITNNTTGGRYLVTSTGASSMIKPNAIDASTDETKQTVTWGGENGKNTLQVDVGHNIQRLADAEALVAIIAARLGTPSYKFTDVRVRPDLRRELADLPRLTFPEQGLSTKTVIAGIKLTGTAGEITQTLTLVALPILIRDFDAAWDAVNPAATVGDFDAHWSGKTIGEFDADPLST